MKQNLGSFPKMFGWILTKAEALKHTHTQESILITLVQKCYIFMYVSLHVHMPYLGLCGSLLYLG